MSRRTPSRIRRWLGPWWPSALALALALLTTSQLGAASATVAGVSIVPPSTDFIPNQTVLIDVQFSEAVTASGAPVFTLNNGGTATYRAANGPDDLLFQYPIAAGDHTNGTALAIATGSRIASSGPNCVVCVNAADTPGGAGWNSNGRSISPSAFIAPTMTTASFGRSYTDALSATCTFTLSEPLATTLTSGDFVVTPGSAATIGTITQSGTTVTVLLSVGTFGALTLAVSPSSIAADANGNVIDSANSAVGAITFGPIPQITAIQALTASPTNAATVSWLVSFNVPVQGVVPGTFTLGGISPTPTVSVPAQTTPSTSWTVQATGIAGSGTLTLAENPGTIGGVTDGAGEAATTSTPNPDQAITVDQVAPTITGFTQTDAVASCASARHYTVTFSKPVLGVTAANFAVAATGGAAGAVGAVSQASSTTWTVAVTGVSVASASGTVSLSVTGTGIMDLAGNALGAVAACPAYTVVPVPTLLSISTSQPSPTNATSVSYTATFNAPVNGLAPANFTPVVTGGATATVSSIATTANPDAFTVTLSPVGGAGTLALGVANLTGVTDGSGDAATPSSLVSAPITVDHTVPTIQSITVAGANPTNASSVTFLVQFSKPVTGVGAGSFTASGVGTGIGAPIASGSSGWLVPVTVAGSGSVGIAVLGSITDLAGNALNTTAPATDESCVVERSPPAIQSITLLDASSTPEPGPVRYLVTFSVPVGDVVAGDFPAPTANLASPFPTIGTPAAVGGGAFASSWVVTMSGITLASGLAQAAVPLQFNAAGASPSVQDALGNVATSAIPGSNVASYTITTPLNAPVLALGAQPTFTERGPAVSPFAGTTLTDPGASQFNGSASHASIDVALSLSSPVAVAPKTFTDDPSDALWLTPPSPFTLGATAVNATTKVAVASLLDAGVQVGQVTFTPNLAQDQSFLHIDLTGAIQVSDAQNLIDGITFNNSKRNPSISQRQLFLSVIDGGGRPSTPVVQHLAMVLMNDTAPLVPGVPLVTTAPAPRIVVPGQALAGHIPTNDVDSFFTCALVDGTGGLHPATAGSVATLSTAQGSITVSQYGDWTYTASATASGIDGFSIQATDVGPVPGTSTGGDALIPPAIISQPIFVVAISTGPGVPVITSNAPVEAEIGGTFDYLPTANLGLAPAQISQASYDLVDLDTQGFAANGTFAINAATGEVTCADVPTAAGGYLQIGILIQVTDTNGTTRGSYQPILLSTVTTLGAGG